MGNNSYLDYKYDGLSSNEKIRQVYRDNLLEDQLKEIEKRNKMLQEQLDRQARYEKDLKIRSDIELEIEDRWKDYNTILKLIKYEQERFDLNAQNMTWEEREEAMEKIKDLYTKLQKEKDRIELEFEAEKYSMSEEELDEIDERVKRTEIKEKANELVNPLTYFARWFSVLVFGGIAVFIIYLLYKDEMIINDFILKLSIFLYCGYLILNPVVYISSKLTVLSKLNYKPKKKVRKVKQQEVIRNL